MIDLRPHGEAGTWLLVERSNTWPCDNEAFEHREGFNCVSSFYVSCSVSYAFFFFGFRLLTLRCYQL